MLPSLLIATFSNWVQNPNLKLWYDFASDNKAKIYRFQLKKLKLKSPDVTCQIAV